ncbi:MAG: hypothetical protein U9O87_05855, partial [Verrucomicrobiota bacterium]|nr:hypothetical protein [Verrucomicrobiota bacterium]
MNWERTEDWQLILGNFDGYIDEVRISAVVQYGADYDGDGLVDQDELLNGTDPLLADTDGDGVDDKVENDAGTNPLDTDSDDDGMPDYIEIFESF